MKTDSASRRRHVSQPPLGMTGGFALTNLLIALGALALIGAGGWAYYNFSWLRRLPQEHTLTDQSGHQIPARLEARTQTILQYTLLADGSTHYYPISLLSDKDQSYVGNLPIGLTVTFPLGCTLTDSHGNPLPAKVIGRNDTLVKLYTPDKVMQFKRLADLSEADQAFLKTFPANLDMAYPVDYVLTDATGKKQSVRIEGHTDQLVRYMVPANGKEFTVLLKTLTPTDHDFVLALPDGLVLRYPIDYTLTNLAQEKFVVHIQGRSSQSVKYVLVADGSTHVDPVDTLSPDDQAFLQLLPQNIQDNYPMARILTKTGGDTLDVRLEGRTDNLIKFSLVSDADELPHYAPINAFSDADKIFIRKLPANLNLDYPLDIALTDQSGSVKKVSLFGRTDTDIKFALSDAVGAPIDYPLTKLSDLDQAAIRLMPMKMSDSTVTAASPASGPHVLAKFSVSPDAQIYLDRLLDSYMKAAPVRDKIQDPNTSSGEVGALRGELQADLAECKSEAVRMANASGSSSPIDYISGLIDNLHRTIDDLNSALSNNEVPSAQIKSVQADLARYNEEMEALQLAQGSMANANFLMPANAAPDSEPSGGSSGGSSGRGRRGGGG